MLTAIFISSVTTNWWAFVFFYGICYPAGVGLVYWTPIIGGWEWFPEHKGLVSGLIIAAYGFGAVIFGPISTAIINPQNYRAMVPEDGSTPDPLFPKSVGEKVPTMLGYCLMIWAVLAIICVFTVKRNPEYVKKLKLKEK